jgi:hypothetical protein
LGPKKLISGQKDMKIKLHAISTVVLEFFWMKDIENPKIQLLLFGRPADGLVEWNLSFKYSR